MKNLFLILTVVGLSLSSCSKEEKTPSVSEISVPSSAVDRDDPTLLIQGSPGGSGTETLTCGWSDGYGTGQVLCEGNNCSLATMTIGGITYVGIICLNGTVPLHTDNYRPM